MLCKYRIESTAMLTGQKPVKDMECDGFALVGIVKDREGKPCEVCVRLHDVNSIALANAMYSNEHLRSVALMVAEIDRMERSPLRRAWNCLFGGWERHEKE